MRAVNHFFNKQVHEFLLPKVDIHELVEVNSMYNEQKIANLTGKTGGLVTNPCKITNSAKCINAWLTSNTF